MKSITNISSLKLVLVNTLLLGFITTTLAQSISQQLTIRDKSSKLTTTFLSFNDKLKKLPHNSPALKMTGGNTPVTLELTKMKVPDYFLSFSNPITVNVFEVSFYATPDKSGLRGLQLEFETAGSYLVEMNVGLYEQGYTDFIVNASLSKQVIKVKNDAYSGDGFFKPAKVVFYIISTAKYSAMTLYATTLWNFRNVQITPLKY